MKQLLRISLPFLLLFTSLNSISQEVYFSTGLNQTSYDFEGTGNEAYLNQGAGNFYELGLVYRAVNDRLVYSVGFSLNELNSSGGDLANYYSWTTNYIGLNNSLVFSLKPTNNFPVDFLVGLSLEPMTILHGEQRINSTLYLLQKEQEFKGLCIETGLAFELKHEIKNNFAISLGYNYSLIQNLSNLGPEQLSFLNRQIRLGINFKY